MSHNRYRNTLQAGRLMTAIAMAVIFTVIACVYAYTRNKQRIIEKESVTLERDIDALRVHQKTVEEDIAATIARDQLEERLLRGSSTLRPIDNNRVIELNKEGQVYLTGKTSYISQP